MKVMKILVAVLTLTVVLIIHIQAQNLILNGSFESPVIPSNTFQVTTPTYWNGEYLIFNGSVPNGFEAITALWPAPEDGQQFAAVARDQNQSYSLSQIFTITNQGAYVLSWFDNVGQCMCGLTNDVYSVTVINTGTTQTITSNTFEAYNPTSSWAARSIHLNLGPATYNLQFQSEINGGLNTLIDNVSLLPTNLPPLINIQKAVYIISTNMLVGSNYQVQASSDLINWTNQGSVFTATNSTWNSTQYWKVSDWNQLFFRLQLAP